MNTHLDCIRFDLCPVIDSGSDAPGIIPGYRSSAFRRRLQGVDLTIAKAQGNFESLSLAGKNNAFFFRGEVPSRRPADWIAVGLRRLCSPADG
jgi:hypothetical protein